MKDLRCIAFNEAALMAAIGPHRQRHRQPVPCGGVKAPDRRGTADAPITAASIGGDDGTSQVSTLDDTELATGARSNIA